MKKKWFILILLIFVSVACVTYFTLSYFSKDSPKEVVQTVQTDNEYEERITELETKLTELQEELLILEASISEVNVDKLNEIQERLNYLEQRNGDVIKFLSEEYGVNFATYH